MELDDIRLSGIAILEEFEKMTINAIEGVEVKVEDVRVMVHPMSPEVAPTNWTTTTIPTIFRLSQ